MSISEIVCDVAIIGYGPTGQMLALLLGEKGYRVAVFERWPTLYPQPRAVHYDHEIARVFQAVGIGETLDYIVEPGGVYEWRNARGETLLSFDWSEQSVSGWPSSTMFPQPQLEAILDSSVKALPGVTVYQGWAAEQVAQTQGAVHLQVIKQVVTSSGELTPAEDRISVRSRYVIGADGANSFLRQHMRSSLTDLVGRSFCLISTVGDPARHLSPDDQAFFTSIGGQLVSISSSEDEHADHIIDLSGA
jgi:2-polyprenyl-6-methoxyphenol hydroxylase-like FAD-dependent oxidoreductase